MNSRQAANMSPNTFRRLLVAHGRTTTPGVFDASIVHKSNEAVKDIIGIHKSEVDVKKNETGHKQFPIKKQAPVDGEHPVTETLLETFWPRKDALLNPPLSKSKSTKPAVASSYSFYARPFKVHGKEAWEFAMRGLGSVDTLMNRYGYVEPMWRGETHQSPLEMQEKDADCEKK